MVRDDQDEDGEVFHGHTHDNDQDDIVRGATNVTNEADILAAAHGENDGEAMEFDAVREPASAASGTRAENEQDGNNAPQIDRDQDQEENEEVDVYDDDMKQEMMAVLVFVFRNFNR